MGTERHLRAVKNNRTPDGYKYYRRENHPQTLTGKREVWLFELLEKWSYKSPSVVIGGVTYRATFSGAPVKRKQLAGGLLEMGVCQSTENPKRLSNATISAWTRSLEKSPDRWIIKQQVRKPGKEEGKTVLEGVVYWVRDSYEKFEFDDIVVSPPVILHGARKELTRGNAQLLMGGSQKLLTLPLSPYPFCIPYVSNNPSPSPLPTTVTSKPDETAIQEEPGETPYKIGPHLLSRELLDPEAKYPEAYINDKAPIMNELISSEKFKNQGKQRSVISYCKRCLTDWYEEWEKGKKEATRCRKGFASVELGGGTPREKVEEMLVQTMGSSREEAEKIVDEVVRSKPKGKEAVGVHETANEHREDKGDQQPRIDGGRWVSLVARIPNMSVMLDEEEADEKERKRREVLEFIREFENERSANGERSYVGVETTLF